MSNAISLAGKVAIVTGGGRGIGKAITHRFAEAGANVVIASRKLENLEATAREYAALPGRIVPVVCHVGRLDRLEHLVQETERQLGPVDILVNNSATNIGQGPALAVTDEMALKMFEINILAGLRLIRLTVPKMIERKTGGSIINIASVSGIRPQPGGLLYSATKAALIMMTRNWALEFGRYNVRVNAIAPGLIQTDFERVLLAERGPSEGAESDSAHSTGRSAGGNRRHRSLLGVRRRLFCDRANLHRGWRSDRRLKSAWKAFERRRPRAGDRESPRGMASVGAGLAPVRWRGARLPALPSIRLDVRDLTEGGFRRQVDKETAPTAALGLRK